MDNIRFDSFEDRPWQNLIVPSQTRELLLALCATHQTRTREAIDLQPQQEIEDDAFGIVSRQLRNSSVFLLHGPPGVGKTFTCECVAAQTRRPLLRLTVKDLGVEADGVYKKLYSWMMLARRWEAILLIDEADIYLEQRSINPPETNALVAIFLHLMEYYSGVLFLTTNRVGAIDDAVFSRVHLTLYYPPFTKDSRTRLWHVLIDQLQRTRPNVKVSDDFLDWIEESDDGSKLDLNGRDITNTLNTAVTIAEDEARKKYHDWARPRLDGAPFKLTTQHLRRVLEAKRQMQEYVMALRGQSEIERARNREERYDAYGSEESSRQRLTG